MRDAALRAVREFFHARDFVEIDAPQLIVAPTTEPHIDPLHTQVTPGVDEPPVRRFLHTSPEIVLKRALAHGVERCFCLSHVFRDGERTAQHLPEFTLLEWYRAGEDSESLIADCEALLAQVSSSVAPQRPAPQAPFDRARVAALFTEHAGVDLPAALDEMAAGDDGALVRRVRAAGHALREGADFEDAFFHVMTARVEPAIGRERPIVVERWPRQMAMLSRLCDDDPRFAERFELYAGGLELANAYLELTDPVEQRARFEADNAARRALGKEPLPVDELFLRELEDMPAAAGIALGFDRLLMLVTGATRIDDVIVAPWR
jgi:lysyl-tRNA synthetase class 2